MVYTRGIVGPEPEVTMLNIKHMAHRSADFVAVAFVVLTFGHVPLRAQVVTDGTVGPAIALSGPDFAIGAVIGTDVFGSGPGGDVTIYAGHLVIDGNDAVLFTGPSIDVLGCFPSAPLGQFDVIA